MRKLGNEFLFIYEMNNKLIQLQVQFLKTFLFHWLQNLRPKPHLDELRFPKEEPNHVGGNVIDGDDRHGDDVKNHSGKCGKVHQVAGNTEEQHPHMGPG